MRELSKESLTEMAKIFEENRPPTYYVLLDDCPIDQIISVPETTFSPKFLIFHFTYLEKAKKVLGKLLPLEDYPREEIIKRIKTLAMKQFMEFAEKI